MAVLYRKYRPQTFAQVLNQKSIIQTLKNQVLSGSLSHAYLFTGSRGVGKTSIARILAKAINCTDSKQGEACGKCEICKQVEAGSFLDLVEIDAASNTGVDNIRELIEHVKFAPSTGKYKVFIIDEVHMLSKGAFNALLKTLEEPPAHSVFILATTEINKVPATIISRTQKFDFKALSATDIFDHLQKISLEENVKINKEVLELIASNAEGSVRDSLSLLDKIMTLGEGASLEDSQQLLGITDISTCENLLELIALGEAKKIPEFFRLISEKGLDFNILNRDFLEFLRKVLIFKITDGGSTFGLSEEHLKKLSGLAEKLPQQEIIFIIRLFLKSYKDLQFAPDAQIPLLIASLEAVFKKNPGVTKTQTITPIKVEQPKVETKTVEQNSEVKFTSEVSQNLEAQVSMDEVERLWPQIVAKIKAVNGPLASMLKSSPLLGVEGSRIIVKVKFVFDKHSLENAKNATLINGVIESVLGKRASIIGQVAKQVTDETIGAAEVISDALKVFGGELVE